LSWYSIEEALPFRVPALHGRPEWGRIRFTSWAGDLHPPHAYPWIRPAMRCAPHGYSFADQNNNYRGRSEVRNTRLAASPTHSCEKRAARQRTARFSLVLFLACFLATAFASQRFFDSLPLAGLQVKRVTLYFLDDVLGLYLALKPSQRVFEGFTLLKSNFRQRTTPPRSS